MRFRLKMDLRDVLFFELKFRLDLDRYGCNSEELSFWSSDEIFESGMSEGFSGVMQIGVPTRTHRADGTDCCKIKG